jgi:hypothetical protein
MLQLRGQAPTTADSQSPGRAAASGGLLFLLLLTASWMIAIGVGWVIWKILPF